MPDECRARIFALMRRGCPALGGVKADAMRPGKPPNWPSGQFSFNGNFDPIPGFNGNWEISESKDWRGFTCFAIPAFNEERQGLLCTTPPARLPVSGLR